SGRSGDGALPGTAFVESMLEALSQVRDALYGLYCDASDPRMAALVTATDVLGIWRGEQAFDPKASEQDPLDHATTLAAAELEAAILLLDIDDTSKVD